MHQKENAQQTKLKFQLYPHFLQPLIQDQPSSGERFVAVHVKRTGASEELKPTLVGLANMAITFLPVGYRFGKVMSAQRELISGVRYTINVLATDNDSAEIVCHLVVVEKPWLLTEWGDKQRTLQHTNCTSKFDEDEGSGASSTRPIDLNANQNFNFNPVFINQGGDLDDDAMKQLESQIFQPKVRTTKPPVTRSDDSDWMKNLEQLILVAPKVTNTPPQTDFPTSTNCDIQASREVVASTSSETAKSLELETTIRPEIITPPSSSPAIQPSISTSTSSTPVDHAKIGDSSNEPIASKELNPSSSTLDATEEKEKITEETKELPNMNAESNLLVIESTTIAVEVAVEPKEHQSESVNSFYDASRKFEETVNEQINAKMDFTVPLLRSTVVDTDESLRLYIDSAIQDEKRQGPSPLTKQSSTAAESSLSRRRRDAPHTTEADFIRTIAQEAIDQLDRIDADDEKRIVLNILKTLRTVHPDKTVHYLLWLRVGISKCLESDEDIDGCADMLLPDRKVKLCNIEASFCLNFGFASLTIFPHYPA